MSESISQIAQRIREIREDCDISQENCRLLILGFL